MKKKMLLLVIMFIFIFNFTAIAEETDENVEKKELTIHLNLKSSGIISATNIDTEEEYFYSFNNTSNESKMLPKGKYVIKSYDTKKISLKKDYEINLNENQVIELKVHIINNILELAILIIFVLNIFIGIFFFK